MKHKTHRQKDFLRWNLVEEKNEILNGLVELIVYENNPKGVEIVFENEDFAILEKKVGS